MKNTLFFLISICFLMSCNADIKQSETSKEGMGELIDKVTESGNDGEGCFIAYQPKVCELIDVQTIAQILGVEVSQIEEKGDASLRLHNYNKKDQPYKGSEYNSCEYVWTDPSGKTYEKKVLNFTAKVPITRIVTVGNIAAVKDIEEFKFKYHPLKEGDLENVNKEVGKELDKNVSEGKNTKAEAEIGKDLVSSMGKGLDIQYVEGIGELSVRIYTDLTQDMAELIVYKGKNHFKVSVDMATKTKEENLAMAKKIALEIVKKCN